MTRQTQGVSRRRRQPEQAEQRSIVELLRLVGCEVWTLGTHRRRGDYPGTMQTPGLPDVLAFLPNGGGVLFVEVKAPGGRLRPDQARFMAACRECYPPHRVHHVVGGLNAVVAYLIELALLRDDQVPHYRLPAAEGA